MIIVTVDLACQVELPVAGGYACIHIYFSTMHITPYHESCQFEASVNVLLFYNESLIVMHYNCSNNTRFSVDPYRSIAWMNFKEKQMVLKRMDNKKVEIFYTDVCSGKSSAWWLQIHS